MKKVFVLCLILTLWGNRKATAIGQCEDGWCCRCSHTAGCVRVTANQWGSTSCTQDCPGPINMNCLGIPPPGGSPGDVATSWVTREEAEQMLSMSLPEIVENCDEDVLVSNVARTATR